MQRKIVILGDSGVGKTALVQRFLTGKFVERYRPTSGAVPSSKAMKLDGREVSVVFWDVAGHMLNIHPAHISDAHGVILVCDLSRQVSAEPMMRWHKLVSEKIGNVPILVAGNKFDNAITDRCESLKEAGFKGYKTSAKTGENVETLFTEIVRATL